MIWNYIKAFFWCGVFHEPKLCMDVGYPDIGPTEKDVGNICICAICGTQYTIE